MATVNKLPIILLFSILFFVSPIYADQTTSSKSVMAICNEFETKIKNLAENKKYVEAINAAAEYEQVLQSKYPSSTFELGLFQSSAQHLSFHNPFDGWKQVNFKDFKIPDWLPSIGFEFLLALKRPVEEDRVLIMSYDIQKITQRISAENPSLEDLTDQQLQLAAQMFAVNFGVIKNQEFKQIGDRRALILDIGTPMMGPSVILATLGRRGCLYMFLLVTRAENRSDNEKRLYDLIKTVDFQYKQPNALKIEEANKKLLDKSNISQLFACVRELALAGEYGEAGNKLSLLRLAIADQMPKPTIDGNNAIYSSYGIILSNPDIEKWKLSVKSEGGIGMLILEDRFSVNNAGILVMVINTILAYGTHAADVTGESASEAERKQFLTSVGRGGIMTLGGVIESERFRMFKGAFAYEAVVLPNMPNVKIKSMVVQKRGYLLMVLMFVDAYDYDSRVKAYETLIDKYLQIKDI